MSLAIIVHGGAGAIAAHRQQIVQDGCAAAVQAGWSVLLEGGSALDAVTVAIQLLEDNPNYNAGTGAVLTTEGNAELDAGIMEGMYLEAGAVAGVRHIKNPILLARSVLRSPQVLLIGDGAESYAVSQGIGLCDPSILITAEQYECWQQSSPTDQSAHRDTALDDPNGKHGTVGAVAIDAQGVCVAGSSTGGIMHKPAGRVGDTPIVGAGFYADNAGGGVACTGNGEGFIRLVLAKRAVELLLSGSTAQQVADRCIQELGERVQGSGGMIIVDRHGQVGLARNTKAMPFGYMMTGMDHLTTGI